MSRLAASWGSAIGITDRADRLEAILLRIAQDFPEHRTPFAELAEAFCRLGDTRPIRELNALCRKFFDDTKAPWKRYDLYCRYWAEFDLVADDDVPAADEEDDDGPDTREMGRLLAQWVISTYYMEEEIRRFTDNAVDRPYWRLVSSVCSYKGHRELDGQTEHHLSQFWQNRRIPGPRLDCRCAMSALTEEEASVLPERAGVLLARGCVVLVEHLLEGRDVGIGGLPPTMMIALRRVQIIGDSIKIAAAMRSRRARIARSDRR